MRENRNHLSEEQICELPFEISYMILALQHEAAKY